MKPGSSISLPTGEYLPQKNAWQWVLLGAILPISWSPAAIAVPPPLTWNVAAASDSNPILLGQPCTNPYIVAIPTHNFQLLDRVQRQVPSAFITDSRLGHYILAGAFTHRLLAESLNMQLRHLGFNARVVYKPIPCQAARE
ncbi:hypothetical protein H6G20_09955 [Desertifilum sp. FACHB-1129]|uniref:SPOR domain-containing protein n=1 Tax=Desertifilum tharense IPPAS B-1220 TaxID=1781255 RepID=A0A1E5QLU0_9CYAN|nr:MULTISPECIES: hypothetical protein [Desertifilum]MCD8489864.1 hypothetical protein [Desertifilum sp.]MDA0211752.1 hypothetical protein [Cyanobacteria bacterium FC1]MBD2311982.1 hypothetical protein [Desertifilum sp. FACHB-1129]MBD2322434.1 hypothetical protein [Desertifilum sp. FACHB-866]MBD2332597.1 hypothetical protein [Desertifilum sp. FACHB-868]